MRALWLADVLEDAGLTVHAYTGWETRGRDDFTPKGVVWHHTVTRPTTSDEVVDRMLAVNGSSTVPAPLGNISTNRDGSISVIAAGTANHAGIGTWKGLSHSRYFVGDEMKNYGTQAWEPWVPRQLESARIAAAAILTHLESDAGYLVAHREYATPPGRKTDPHSLDMADERERVALLMEDDMPTPDEIWREKYSDPVTGVDVFAITLLRLARNDAHKAALDAAVARSLAEASAARGSALSAAEIDQIGKEVAEAFIEELTD